MPEDRFKYVSAPGVPDIGKLRADGFYPSEERIAAGPVAVFECMQAIPCNPCEQACRKGCIVIGDDITAIPRLTGECNGCGMCVTSCPGLCIFVLDGNYNETEATVTMPYEFLPLPVKGEVVDALGRGGETICKGRIISVIKFSKTDVCYALTVAIPRQFVHNVRHIRRKIP